MKVYPIISTTNSIKQTFKSNPSLRLNAVKPLEERGNAVLRYIKKGCPKTTEGEKLFKEMFAPEIYDLYRICIPVEEYLQNAVIILKL